MIGKKEYRDRQSEKYLQNILQMWNKTEKESCKCLEK